MCFGRGNAAQEESLEGMSELASIEVRIAKCFSCRAHEGGFFTLRERNKRVSPELLESFASQAVSEEDWSDGDSRGLSDCTDDRGFPTLRCGASFCFHEAVFAGKAITPNGMAMSV